MGVRKIVILSGPNGAGKTTASSYLLRDALRVDEFVNAEQQWKNLAELSQSRQKS